MTIAVLVIGTVFVGCSSKPPPVTKKKLDVPHVEGVVLFEEEPRGGINLVFFPVDALPEDGLNVIEATVDGEGKFKIPFVSGNYLVTVTVPQDFSDNPEMNSDFGMDSGPEMSSEKRDSLNLKKWKDKIPERYTNLDTTDLEITVTDASLEEPIELKLWQFVVK